MKVSTKNSVIFIMEINKWVAIAVLNLLDEIGAGKINMVLEPYNISK